MKVYAGIDPLTGREIRLRRTCKTERAAQIELGKLLAQAVAGRQSDSAVAQLLDQYVSTAGWDVSTREKQPRVYPLDHQACTAQQRSRSSLREPLASLLVKVRWADLRLSGPLRLD